METRRPHYLLYSQSNTRQQPGTWNVVLKTDDGQVLLEAGDTEPETQGERLELLAVVRGLEALDHPARVTLATPSRYVRRGLMYGLEEWRANGWSWEWFGRMVPIKNRDLWQRLDRALVFHDVQCRYWRIDTAHEWLERPKAEQTTSLTPQLVRANAFDRATAEAGIHTHESRNPRRKTTNSFNPRRKPQITPPAARHSPVSTFVRSVGMFLVRLGGGPMLAPAGRLASPSRE